MVRVLSHLSRTYSGVMSAPAADGVVPLWRNRDFQLLWGGQAVSLLGSQTSKIAYPLLVLALTGSPAKAGIAGFAAMLGYLLFPLPAGGLAHRDDRKRIMIACDAIRLAAVGSIAAAGWAAHITYMQVLLAGFAEGAASVFFGLAQRAALPMLVHPSQRPVAVGQDEARQNAAPWPDTTAPPPPRSASSSRAWAPAAWRARSPRPGSSAGSRQASPSPAACGSGRSCSR